MNKYLSLGLVSIAPIMLLSASLYILIHIIELEISSTAKLIIVEFSGTWVILSLIWVDIKLIWEFDKWKQ